MTEARATSNAHSAAPAGESQAGTGDLDMAPEEVRNLVHDLQTHQIELEIQNEELRRIQEELVESRDRYSDLYDFAPVGYVTLSHQGVIIEANLTLADMLGVERGALVHHPLSAFILPADQDVLYLHHREILTSNQPEACQIRMLCHDAGPLWAEMDSILIETDDESDGWFRTVISDITERKRAEEERLALERQVQHAQKLESLGLLAGGIAHDFNNLLMTILGNTELALGKLSPMSSARDNLQKIESLPSASGRRRRD